MATKATKEATAAAASASETPTLQSTLLEIVRLPCAREYFFQMALTGWGYCRADIKLFQDESDRYTETFIDEQVTLINTVKALPDVAVRLAEVSLANDALVAWRQQVGSLSKRLGKALAYTFKNPATLEAERKLSGLYEYGIPSSEPWGSVDKFLTKANTYLTNKIATLVAAKATKESLQTQFVEAAAGFTVAWTEYIAKEKAYNDGTKAVNDGLKAILAELNPMLDDGKSIYEFDPVNIKKFTIKYLVREVRGGHPAGLEGYMYFAETGKPMANARVVVAGDSEKFAVTDAKGKYKLNLAEGSFDFIYSAAGMAPQTVARKLTAGVSSRQNVSLSPVPVEVAIVPETPQLAAPVTNTVRELANAVSGVMNGATNGATNGAAV
ncbi:MAG: carboxypeptidase regulatory-like domain-containing protein [Saprospiraceae bacterium]|nr:carboxypeptidase regulatory-like domain-containing protein [Saprospiraceae bacterium]